MPKLNDVVILGWNALIVVHVDDSGFTCRCPATGRTYFCESLNRQPVEVSEIDEPFRTAA